MDEINSVMVGFHMNILCFLTALLSTLIGSLSGLGGGVIIKPVLDTLFFSRLPLAEINLLSSLTVFVMAVLSTVKAHQSDVQLDKKIILPLSISSGIGGLLGDTLFQKFLRIFPEELCRHFQSRALLFLMVSLLILHLFSEKIPARSIRNVWATALCGLCLGTASSFFGIGGGPLNVVVLTLLFHLEKRQCVFGSLSIIMFAQGIKLVNSILIQQLWFSSGLLPVWMVIGGILGGWIGSRSALLVSERKIGHIFSMAMVFVIILNLANSF